MLKKHFIRFASVFVCLVLIMCSANIMFASAAAYSGGSGTKKDPYLIKTADDLYNMRDNLSAHFKLAATIDMKGYKTDSKYFNGGFVPIGDDSTKPFTGSFTCDLGSDGLPLYAILNLNIYNKKGELFNHDWYSAADYPDALGMEPPYFYQTALFGTTRGAGIYNIYVLNATVYSSVVGQHSGRYADGTEGSLVSYKAFMDTQSTGILIGEAINTSVSHCAATGSVKGKTSRHGGLIGAIVDSNISDSYVDVVVDTGGCWTVGNFIGRVAGMSVISNCFSSGKLNASLDGYGKMLKFKQKSGSGAGGFIGTIDATSCSIKNCWTNVKVSSKTRGNNFYGIEMKGGQITKKGVITNCFSYGAYEGKSSAPEGVSNTDNCYISNSVNGLQADFNAASPKDINKYFLTIDGWKKGDTYPVLSSTNVVENAKIYVPGAEREGVTKEEVTVPDTPDTENTVSQETQSDVTSSETHSEVADNETHSEVVDNETQSEVADNGTQENTVFDSETTQSEDNGTSTEGKVTEIKNENIDEEKLTTIQLTLIAVLSVLIIAISVLTAIMVYNTLKTKKSKDEEDNVLSDEEEGVVIDAE